MLFIFVFLDAVDLSRLDLINYIWNTLLDIRGNKFNYFYSATRYMICSGKKFKLLLTCMGDNPYKYGVLYSIQQIYPSF